MLLDRPSTSTSFLGEVPLPLLLFPPFPSRVSLSVQGERRTLPGRARPLGRSDGRDGHVTTSLSRLAASHSSISLLVNVGRQTGRRRRERATAGRTVDRSDRCALAERRDQLENRWLMTQAVSRSDSRDKCVAIRGQSRARVGEKRPRHAAPRSSFLAAEPPWTFRLLSRKRNSY